MREMLIDDVIIQIHMKFQIAVTVLEAGIWCFENDSGFFSASQITSIT